MIPTTVRPTRFSKTSYKSSCLIQRPNNATAYNAGDVVGGVLTFPQIGIGGAEIMVTSVTLDAYISAIPAGMSSFSLYLYDSAPPSGLADNAVFDLPAVDRDAYKTIVPIPQPLDVGSTLTVQVDGLNKQLLLRTNSLWGYLVTTGGFTPGANSEQYLLTLYSLTV